MAMVIGSAYFSQDPWWGNILIVCCYVVFLPSDFISEPAFAVVLRRA